MVRAVRLLAAPVPLHVELDDVVPWCRQRTPGVGGLRGRESMLVVVEPPVRRESPRERLPRYGPLVGQPVERRLRERLPPPPHPPIEVLRVAVGGRGEGRLYVGAPGRLPLVVSELVRPQGTSQTRRSRPNLVAVQRPSHHVNVVGQQTIRVNLEDQPARIPPALAQKPSVVRLLAEGQLPGHRLPDHVVVPPGPPLVLHEQARRARTTRLTSPRHGAEAAGEIHVPSHPTRSGQSGCTTCVSQSSSTRLTMYNHRTTSKLMTSSR